MQFSDLIKGKDRSFWLQAMIGCCGAVVIAAHYRIGFDLLMLFFLFFSCWCAGTFFPISREGWERELLRLACGMSITGLVLYGLLTLGWGGRVQYLLVLALPIFCWNFRGREIPTHPIPKGYKTSLFLWFLAVLAALLLVYASMPVDFYDSLTGHLPITMYGTRTGAFYTNIAESITYAQTGMFYYGFWILLASFGAYKAMSMLNVVLFYAIFAILLVFCKKIYSRTSPLVLAILFFSVPLFSHMSTLMYLEMLPIFLAFSGFFLIVECRPEDGWRALPLLALLFSCAVISKLTITYTILSGGILAIWLFFFYVIKEKVPARKAAVRFFLSGVIFLIITSTPYLLAWYRYGNPFLPFFNDIFKSPYYPAIRFVDPFQNSPLGFSLKALFTIVFHTSQNVEMMDGGMGVFLLLLPFIPLSWLIHRKIPVLVWGGLIFFSYGVSTLFTYNLRYYMAIFMLACALISVGLCAVFQSLPRIRYGCVAVALVFALPGILYIATAWPFSWSKLTRVSDEIYVSIYSNLMKEIPDGKRVLGFDTVKGDYNGYVASLGWHGAAWQCLLEEEGVSLLEYISEFDYLLCDPSIDFQKEILNDCMNSGIMELTLISRDSLYHNELYQINRIQEKETFLTEEFEEPISISTDTPYRVSFSAEEGDAYQIAQEIGNDGPDPINIRFQINWYDANDKFIGWSLDLYSLQPDERYYNSSVFFTAPAGAVTGTLYLSPHDEGCFLTAYGYELYYIQGGVFDRINSLVGERTYLKR